jgi:hypothetical protein
MVFDPQGVWVAQASQGRKIVAEKGVGPKCGMAQRVARFYPVGLTASNLALLRLLPAKVFPQAMGLAAISMRLRPVRLAA